MGEQTDFKNYKWFACATDDGFIAAANTLNELLAMFGRSSAKYVSTGVYEFSENNEHYGWTIFVYRGLTLAQHEGFDIDDNEQNSWHLMT